MPAKSKKQRGLMCADLARKRAGKKTRTGMSEAQLEEFCRTPKKKSNPIPKNTLRPVQVKERIVARPGVPVRTTKIRNRG
jgi:hypothetical protein